MKKMILICAAVVVLSLFLAACSGGDSNETPVPSVQVPSNYAGKTNPFAGDTAAATAGQTIYATNCASCHGESGAGDGPAGTALDPKPGNLRNIAGGDDYIFWRISEGGSMDPFKSSMPAWKGVVSEEDIWRVVAHIRTLK